MAFMVHCVDAVVVHLPLAPRCLLTLGPEQNRPIAEILQQRKIPFALATGYNASHVPKKYDGCAILEKPFEIAKLQKCIEKMVSSRS